MTSSPTTAAASSDARSRSSRPCSTSGPSASTSRPTSPISPAGRRCAPSTCGRASAASRSSCASVSDWARCRHGSPWPPRPPARSTCATPRRPPSPATRPCRRARSASTWPSSASSACTASAADVRGICASIVLQAATLHSPEDLVLVVIEGRGPRPRLVGQVASPHPLDHVARRRHPRRREPRRRPPRCSASWWRWPGYASARTDRADHRWPWVLVVLDDAADVDPAVVSQLLELCPDAGHLGRRGDRQRRPRPAPGACRRCAASRRSAARCRRCGSPIPTWTPRSSSPSPANARLVDQVAMSLGSLARRHGGQRHVGDPTGRPAVLAVRRRGADRPVDRRDVGRAQALRTPGADRRRPGRPARRSTSSSTDPHALIGGTSGAGKSELLQSIVASLIAGTRPTRLTFLFVDYKGGAASVVFNDVPHTVGYVTNLDANLSLRALTSLRAELNHRMRLMEGKAKDLAEMLERHPDDAPPSLVIVVDEFATLVKEVPDFVAGVVDIAQRGRSLGIHLVLATQRPSGVGERQHPRQHQPAHLAAHARHGRVQRRDRRQGGGRHPGAAEGSRLRQARPPRPDRVPVGVHRGRRRRGGRQLARCRASCSAAWPARSPPPRRAADAAPSAAARGRSSPATGPVAPGARRASGRGPLPAPGLGPAAHPPRRAARRRARGSARASRRRASRGARCSPSSCRGSRSPGRPKTGERVIGDASSPWACSTIPPSRRSTRRCSTSRRAAAW